MKKFLKWTVIVLGGLASLVLLTGLALYPIGMKILTRSYPDTPVEMVNVPTDPDAVARGRHIAAIWACTKCHGEDLSGKLLSDDPILGTVPSSNLTSGKGGVAGAYTETDWIRAIRHGVKPDGKGEIIMYDFSTLSDQDLGDLIAYLKQIQPVDSVHPVMRLGPILPIAPAVGLLTPAAEMIDHGAPRPTDPLPGATIEYGKYLSSICLECHSSKGLTGKLQGWGKDDFIRAIQTGILPDGKQLTPAMPLKTYGQLNETELAALWLYFRDVKP